MLKRRRTIYHMVLDLSPEVFAESIPSNDLARAATELAADLADMDRSNTLLSRRHLSNDFGFYPSVILGVGARSALSSIRPVSNADISSACFARC